MDDVRAQAQDDDGDDDLDASHSILPRLGLDSSLGRVVTRGIYDVRRRGSRRRSWNGGHLRLLLEGNGLALRRVAGLLVLLRHRDHGDLIVYLSQPSVQVSQVYGIDPTFDQEDRKSHAIQGEERRGRERERQKKRRHQGEGWGGGKLFPFCLAQILFLLEARSPSTTNPQGSGGICWSLPAECRCIG